MSIYLYSFKALEWTKVSDVLMGVWWFEKLWTQNKKKWLYFCLLSCAHLVATQRSLVIEWEHRIESILPSTLICSMLMQHIYCIEEIGDFNFVCTLHWLLRKCWYFLQSCNSLFYYNDSLQMTYSYNGWNSNYEQLLFKRTYY